MTLSRLALAVLSFGLLGAFPDPAAAQSYPVKPIRIVVPWAPGGSTDVLARLIGIKMSENWGQPAVVENKPGASGNIGSELVAKAPPDGYTLLVGSVSTHAMNPYLMASMPFKGVDDFSTIALAAYVTNVLVTHPSVPAKSVRELIELLKAQPGKIAYASAGNGSPNHVAAELFRRLAAVDMLHVPYKGGGPAMQGFLGAQVDSFFATPISSISQIRAGKAKAVATTGSKRAALMPEVPTVAESGFPGYEALNWYGFLGPKGMQKDIVERLNKELVKALAHPQVVAALHKTGTEPKSSTAEEFAAYIKREYDTWGKVVKEAGIKAQ
jgi:tripartite-type tricarboxylate transporter receptor subunit TctC